MKDAQNLVIKLRAMGKKIFFVTNNSTKTRDGFLKKFNELGFQVTLVRAPQLLDSDINVSSRLSEH
jgi:ribonucleotide monophosphatase NagD (HAD superfamily)